MPSVLVALQSPGHAPAGLLETLERLGVEADQRSASQPIAGERDIAIVENDPSGDTCRAWSATGALVLCVPQPDDALASLNATLTGSGDRDDAPIATLAAGKGGPINAALAAVAVLANTDQALLEKLERFRSEQTAKVLQRPDPSV